MKRPALIMATVLSVLVLVMASAYSQDDMEFVSNEMFDNPQRGTAVFLHDQHNETAEIEDCAECHHLYDENGQKAEDESSEDQSCADCHGDQDKGRQPNLIKAFHVNCKGCHLNQKKGPILCAQCHAN